MSELSSNNTVATEQDPREDNLANRNSSDDGRSDANQMIKVEVAFATPEKQLIQSLEVKKGTTAHEAILLSNIAAEFEQFDVLAMPIGIFSKSVDKDYVLYDLDRVEIYRPLIADPKEVRKKRAAEAKAKKDAEKEQEKLIKAQEKAARRSG
jgi:uncharacterized protein